MSEISRLDSITESSFDDAVAATVDLLRTARPDLDLRAGTAVRALVVEPAATAAAALSGDIESLRRAISVESLLDGHGVSATDANAVLSNFGVSLRVGDKATGLVRIVRSISADTSLALGTTFTDVSGNAFVSTRTVRASLDPVGDEEQLVGRGDGTYYYTVPVESVSAGTGSNVVQGTEFTLDTSISGLVFCDAYADFTGGTDGENVAAAVARIPSALAYRGLTNGLSTHATLAAGLPDASQLRAVSCVGYRRRAMLRDKHNTLNVSVGGRADVYVRTFDAPTTVTFVSRGVRVPSDDGSVDYDVPIPDDYAGFYAVKRIGRAEYSDIQSSLRHELVREPVDPAAWGWHDIDVSLDACELAWSTWQRAHVRVHDLARYPMEDGGVYVPQDEADFKVELYYAPGVPEMQALVDSPDVRNVVADHVVRTPPICLVDVVATVYRRRGTDVSPRYLEDVVAAYINSRSFTGRLTRSELANVLLQHGVESVDLGAGGMQLSGRVNGADGVWYELHGDVLDTTTAIGPDRAMLADDTVVFAAEADAVHISVCG